MHKKNKYFENTFNLRFLRFKFSKFICEENKNLDTVSMVSLINITRSFILVFIIES